MQDPDGVVLCRRQGMRKSNNSITHYFAPLVRSIFLGVRFGISIYFFKNKDRHVNSQFS